MPPNGKAYGGASANPHLPPASVKYQRPTSPKTGKRALRLSVEALDWPWSCPDFAQGGINIAA